MTEGRELLERVRTAQAELGTGDAGDALEMVEPLLEETAEALRGLDFLSRSPTDREQVLEAFCYARVTAILALESVGAAAAVPRISSLAGEALEIATPANNAWKVCCSASEMLGRAGDAEGAVRWARSAARLAPDEEYVIRLKGSIRSMFPGVFDAAEQADR